MIEISDIWSLHNDLNMSEDEICNRRRWRERGGAQRHMVAASKADHSSLSFIKCYSSDGVVPQGPSIHFKDVRSSIHTDVYVLLL